MLLLDTHAILWLGTGARITDASRIAIDDASLRGEVLVSPVSAWEIGLLVAKGRLALDRPPRRWFAYFLGLPGVRLVPLTPEAAIASSFLPETFHSDPADRLLVATAVTWPAALVTRDARILAYAGAGHVRALAC
jgi:PIN domain nuclease of toxin-antitoxin system